MTQSKVEIKIRGYHVDVFGVVNHAWFVQFFEEARWAYLDERPGLRNGLHSAGVAHSVVSLRVEYKHPARLGNLLGIETRLSRASRRSITFEQKAAIIPGEEPAAIAQVTNVFFRIRGGEVVEVDDRIFDPWSELKDLYNNSLLAGKSAWE